MLKLENESELKALHEGNVKESVYLEYKASGAVDKKDDTKKLEIARDVSAFANSVGGQIIYSMTEKDHEPAGLDDGIDPKIYPTLWFEQILQQHVTPNILGLDIKHIPLSTGLVAVRINIPAGSGDPHQASDGKYYRRHNFNRLAMDHYEIRGLFYRTVTPELFIELALVDQPHHNLTLPDGINSERTNPFAVRVEIGNRSKQPSYYSVVNLYADARLHGGPPGFSGGGAALTNTGVHVNKSTKLFNIPTHFPIFSEMNFSAVNDPWAFTLPAALIDREEQFAIGYSILAPGFTVEKFGVLVLKNRQITLLMG
jgi:hypothetical protein